MRLPILLLMSSLFAACAGQKDSTQHFKYDPRSDSVQASHTREVVGDLHTSGGGSASVSEEGAVRRMESALAATERLLKSDEVSDEEREALTESLHKARTALERYRVARAKKTARMNTLGAIGIAAGVIVADDATGVGVLDDPLLVVLALAAMQTAIQENSPSLRDELANSWLELGQQLEALRHTVAMTSKGNVIHEHLVDEARDRIIERAAKAGVSLAESQIKHEMLCEEFERMMREFRRAKNTDKWKKTISTQKGLECRPSRNSRE